MDQKPFLPSRFAAHKFTVLIAGTILVSLILVSVALWLYSASGTELLDLSRPGYQNISKKITNEQDRNNGFPSTGQLDSSAMSEFQSMYLKSKNSVTVANPFGGDPLNPDTLGLGDTTPAPAN